MPSDPFAYLKIGNTLYEVKDEQARVDLGTLAGVVDGKVPKTTTVNNKALSANITLTASDIGYDNSGSGMTATTDQAAIDELDGRVATLEGGGGSGWTITYSADPDEKLTFTAS